MVNEYLDKDYMLPLKQYMNMSEDEKACECAYMCPWHLIDFMELRDDFFELVEGMRQNGDLPEDLWDMDSVDISEHIGPLFRTTLKNFSGQYIDYVMSSGGKDMPLFVIADYVKEVHNEWLVHMTNNYQGVWHEGFSIGVDVNDLAYTPGRGTTKFKHGAGYNFAFNASRADEAENSCYGDYCILFQASGIEIYHHGDEQYQTIFYGPSAKNLILILRPDYGNYAGMWCIEDELRSGNYLCHFEDLQDAVYWAIKNYAQYTSHLTGRGQQKRFDTNKKRDKNEKWYMNEAKKTVILSETQLSTVAKKCDISPDTFNANIRHFLHQLKSDPVHAQPPTLLRAMGITRGKLISLMVKRGIIERHDRLNDKNEDGTPKTATMKVSFTIKDKVPDEFEYRVPKNDFDRKIEKLRMELFEKNLPAKQPQTQIAEKYDSFKDDLSLMKNSPLTMGVIAPPEGKHPSPETWLANRASEAYNKKIEDGTLSEEGGDGGATSANASGAFVQPLFGMIRRKINEKLKDSQYSSRYRDLGGGFDIQTEDNSPCQSLVTIQNVSNKTLYHICFDGSNFKIYRDKRDGQPCEHVSYVFDRLLDAFENNGYSTLEENKTVIVSEDQLKQVFEATSTASENQ